MGIKDLWTILGPFCERKPLYELQGKTVAIDLSCWVCEAQNISEYQVQPRMYLRNLYFRTCYLLLLGVNPVFVLEGKAPTLKYDTIAARNAIQFKGAKPRNNTKNNAIGKDRSRFNYTLKQCEEMLEYMGLACINGNGEAEAMCAYLNEDGLVEACISQDSDCFAYGAKIVYRNFSVSQQGVHSASGGCVDVYDIEKLITSNGFGRYKIIALALLCGSDYCDGVFGIGKDSALKLFDIIPDEKILDRLRSWKSNSGFYEELYRKINDKNICTACGHGGKLQFHNKNGCVECHTNTGCDSSKFKDERAAVKNELNMRAKALQDPEFPNEKLINEFLMRKDKVSGLNLKWKQPDFIKFVQFTVKYLQWKEIYAFEKFLPVLTRWQLINYKQIQKGQAAEQNILYPNYIKKIRNPKGISSYEIIWTDKNACIIDIIPQEQLEGVEAEKLWSTIEPQKLVEEAYPDLVKSFQESKVKKKVNTKRKKKTSVTDLEEMMHNTSISEPKVKVKKSRGKQKVKKNAIDELESSFSELKIEKVSNTKQKTIDSYLKLTLIKNVEKNKNLKEIESPKPVTNANSSEFDFDLSNFEDGNDDNLSFIIEDIIKKPPKYVDQNLQRILNQKQDHFECNNQPGASSESDDSFVDNYRPLIERLKNKN